MPGVPIISQEARLSLMITRLPAGQYFGEKERQLRLGDLIFSELRYEGEADFSPHTHESAFLTVVLSGGQTEVCQGSECCHKVGTLALQPAEEVHRHRIGSTGLRCINVEFGANWLRANALIKSCLARPRRLEIGQHTFLACAATILRSELRLADGLSRMALEAAVLSLLAQLTRLDGPLEKRRPTQWLKTARDILHESFGEPLSLKSVAASVGVHPVHLSREFPKHFGVTLADYLRRMRINYACQALSKADQPLTAIALDAGFADQAHFTRCFKRATGVTPAAYRRSMLTPDKTVDSLQDKIEPEKECSKHD